MPFRPLYSNSNVLFTWLISRIFSANEQYFSLIINRSTVLSAIAYQPSEQGNKLLYMNEGSVPYTSGTIFANVGEAKRAGVKGASFDDCQAF